MNRQPQPPWLRALARMASLKVAVIGLFLLLLLTVWGTLHQVDHGLYQAQQRFYYSWVFLAGGWLPLPGATLVMAVLLINLVASVLYLSVVGRMRWGYLLTHGGLMLMLAAGGVTYYLGEESYLTLAEGEGANVSASYHEWEVVCWPPSSDPTRREIAAVDADDLTAGMVLPLIPGTLELVIDDYHRHCVPQRGAMVSPANLSGIEALNPARPPNTPSERRPGAQITARVEGGTDSRLLLYAEDPGPASVLVDDTPYLVALRRKRMLLPATIELIDFKKELYTGSQIARSFSSRVLVREDAGSERQVLISMNKPLRHKGFTFYQSSYSDQGGRETSTFSVVKNYGRLLPYVATTATGVGMSLHFLGLLIARARRDAGKGARI